ncbi:putative 7-carboxy-7-deazaguanine synthase QueE [Ruminococcus sp. NK3A76]|uniref:putative 7-carboxy-7-deazaguanine synthase QueE n=1 Tax=Ruminococcus sp. NK3A76 TaxID=877411 RepID=UPI00048FDD4B|nr:putative 7-carboxy-7-deazaguanine synthase QueE [Ruminococcus sp. NK3A76]
MSSLKLAESFVSINGEGQQAGALALFLRFTGCNLKCDWCDTAWANEKGAPFELASISRLTGIARDAIEKYDLHCVTLTGGEPLLQEGIDELILALTKLGLRVEIETNGSVDIRPFMEKCRPVFTVDYKLPSSRMERHMFTDNIPLLKEWDTLKFVCGSRQDLYRAAEVIEEYKPLCTVLLSPVFGRIEPAEIVEFMKEKRLGKARLQLQLHKLIWSPDERGV